MGVNLPGAGSDALVVPGTPNADVLERDAHRHRLYVGSTGWASAMPAALSARFVVIWPGRQ